MSGFTSVGYFLFSLFFSLVIFSLWIRFALRYFRVSSLHPVSQTIAKLTNPLINPLDRLFKTSNVRSNPYDWACLTAIIAAELVKFSLLFLFASGTFPFPLIMLYTLAELITEPCNLLFYAILIRVIISWINPHLRNPLIELVYIFTEPTLRLARSSIPVVSGIDFSPFVVMVALKIITVFISASLPVSFF
jgi:YggT family protein